MYSASYGWRRWKWLARAEYAYIEMRRLRGAFRNTRADRKEEVVVTVEEPEWSSGGRWVMGWVGDDLVLGLLLGVSVGSARLE